MSFPISLIHPRVRLISHEIHRATLHDGDRVVREWNDPIDALRWLSESIRGERQRWCGFLSYDLGRLFEPSATARRDPNSPLFVFGHTSQGKAARMPSIASSSPQSNFRKSNYLAAVGRSIDYIRAGDVFQVNLAQTFTSQTSFTPQQVLARLAQRSPALYPAIIQLDDFAIVSNSPELFARVDGASRRIVNRPIKGTRPNAPGMHDELLHSVKDQAELAMIVDLQRNDLGRICRAGTVRVTEPRVIETHPTVLHGVATIEGALRAGIHFVDILAAIFPCGSVTGCPKIRAMQIIDELEPSSRGPYCGAIGWLDPDGSMEFSVAIRTMIFNGHTVRIAVGGGIVADSQPLCEFDETLIKARAMFTAIDATVPQDSPAV